MKYDTLEQRVDTAKLKQYFSRQIPRSADEIEYGELYGSLRENKIELYYKTKPRTVEQCVSQYLYAEIDQEGSVRYCYKPTIFRALLTIAPFLAAALGILGGMLTREPILLLVPALFALLAGGLLLYEPKARRVQLQNALSRAVGCAMGREEDV